MLKEQFKDTITQGQIRLPQSNLKKKNGDWMDASKIWMILIIGTMTLIAA